MMGKRVMAEPVFSTVRIDDHLSATHLLRAVDTLLDTAFVRRTIAPHYSLIGRPSIGPELMMRMLLVGYLGGIRSERKLCAGMHLNLAHRWFCRLGMDDIVPNHSTFSKNRHRRFRDGNVFRAVFEQVVRRYVEAGLVPGEGAAVDGSHVDAVLDAESRDLAGDHLCVLPNGSAGIDVRVDANGVHEAACTGGLHEAGSGGQTFAAAALLAEDGFDIWNPTLANARVHPARIEVTHWPSKCVLEFGSLLGVSPDYALFTLFL